MINIDGTDGVEVVSSTSLYSDNIDFVVGLDSNTRDLLDFVSDLRSASTSINGYVLGDTISQLLETVAALQTQIGQDRWYRDNNAAVAEAWSQYQLMLGLARENDHKD